MKRVALLSLLLILLLGTGCERQGDNLAFDPAPLKPQPLGTEIDVAAVIASQQTAMAAVNSCLANVYLELALQSSATTVSELSVVANMRSSIDAAAHLLGTTIGTTLVLPTGKQESEQRIVVDAETVYSQERKGGSSPGKWQVQALDPVAAEQLWDEQNAQLTGTRYAQLLTPEGFICTGQETVGGRTCLVLQAFDVEQLAGISPELLQQLQSVGLSPEQLQGAIEQAELVCLIDAETFHLCEFRLDARVKQELPGQRVTGTIKQYCRFSAFNQPVEIDIPVIK